MQKWINTRHGRLCLGAFNGFGGNERGPCPAPSKRSLSLISGRRRLRPGYTQVLPDSAYTKERGFGFEPVRKVQAVHRSDKENGSCISSDSPFLFSVAVPEGNYQVTVALGDAGGESKTTVKAEIRRLMVEKAAPAVRQGRVVHVQRKCPHAKNFRRAARFGSRTAKRPAKPAPGMTSSHWNLTMRVPASAPWRSKRSITLPVVYVCGDSTVCDQPGEAFASWGQMLPRFFKTDVVIANHGESGESLRGFLGEKRWDKVMSLLKPGDFMLVQMGHNDEKEKGEGVGAFTTYKADLKRLVADTRKKGATPVVITPMERRNFVENKIRPSHGDYPEAVRQVAKEENVALIDLNAMSIKFYESMGPDKAYLAFAGTGPKRDATHHDNYGAYELAKCIVMGIREDKLDLAKSIRDDFQSFDPSKPDDVDSFTCRPAQAG